MDSGSHPRPNTPHPTPYTLHSTPHTLHLTLHTLNPTPYTLHSTRHTLHPPPSTRHLPKDTTPAKPRLKRLYIPRPCHTAPRPCGNRRSCFSTRVPLLVFFFFLSRGGRRLPGAVLLLPFLPLSRETRVTRDVSLWRELEIFSAAASSSTISPHFTQHLASGNV